jgi:aminopeptidase
MASLTFEQKLQRYADLAVKVGLNVQPGQRVIIIAGPLEVAPVVRAVTASAYQLGSRLVSVLWVDEQLAPIRYQYAPRDSFEEYPAWTMKSVLNSIEQGDAYLQIIGQDPQLLKGQDPDLVALAGRTHRQHYKPIGDHQGINSVQWLVICPPTPGWATKVFPEKSSEEAVNDLWDAVFKACRIDEPDPIAAWQQQIVNLKERKEYLTARQYAGLQFTGPGTDLMVGLPEGHIWAGGESKTQNDVPFIPNLPTEEVYTIPHNKKTEGTVTATKPLSYQGNLIENFSLTFSEGKVVNFSAEKEEAALRSIIEAGENSGRLGEVALIPHKTPISQSGLVFLNTLYDENASNHLALGWAFRYTLIGGDAMTDEEFEQAGGNESIVHVDFMFGSGEMNVDGVKADGTAEPVIRDGEWAFDV